MNTLGYRFITNRISDMFLRSSISMCTRLVHSVSFFGRFEVSLMVYSCYIILRENARSNGIACHCYCFAAFGFAKMFCSASVPGRLSNIPYVSSVLGEQEKAVLFHKKCICQLVWLAIVTPPARDFRALVRPMGFWHNNRGQRKCFA